MRTTRPDAGERPGGTRAGGALGRVRRLVRGYPVAAAVVVAAAVLAAVVVLTLYQPQRLLIDERVDEATPLAGAPVTTPSVADPTPTTSGGGAPASTTAPATAGPKVLGRGTFRGLAHRGSGTALLVELEDGQRVLRLEDLDVENGPDLFVYLTAAPADSPRNAFDDNFVTLGRLKGNQGNQNYDVPAGIGPPEYPTVVIWCKRFSVGFAVAPIT
ncbi:MAG: DM13 domain-containing protein [Sporichthyaceae bacterium]|nr:DM13 domain-containing protein [Sporichthyaceae bacterium]